MAEQHESEDAVTGLCEAVHELDDDDCELLQLIDQHRSRLRRRADVLIEMGFDAEHSEEALYAAVRTSLSHSEDDWVGVAVEYLAQRAARRVLTERFPSDLADEAVSQFGSDVARAIPWAEGRQLQLHRSRAATLWRGLLLQLGVDLCCAADLVRLGGVCKAARESFGRKAAEAAAQRYSSATLSLAMSGSLSINWENVVCHLIRDAGVTGVLALCVQAPEVAKRHLPLRSRRWDPFEAVAWDLLLGHPDQRRKAERRVGGPVAGSLSQIRRVLVNALRCR